MRGGTPTLPGQLQVTCDPSVTATGFRFYYQRPILDPEPIPAGGATDPLFVITGLASGQTYAIYVSATNGGGESDLSEPATAVATLAAAASPAFVQIDTGRLHSVVQCSTIDLAGSRVPAFGGADEEVQGGRAPKPSGERVGRGALACGW